MVNHFHIYVNFFCFFFCFYREDIFTEVFLNMRYEGTDCSLMCTPEKHDVRFSFTSTNYLILCEKSQQTSLNNRHLKVVHMETLKKHFLQGIIHVLLRNMRGYYFSA